MKSQQSPNGKVVSLINMKGGVGKTTLAVGLAWELSKKYRILLVDVDPQFNATQWLVSEDDYLSWIRSDTRRTIFDIYIPDRSTSGIGGFGRKGRKRPSPTLKNCAMKVSHGATTLDIIPSTLELITLDAAPRGTENMLRIFLHTARQKYDYTIIDCPPTSSLFSLSAYIASDAYLVPVKPDPLSVLGLPLLERTMENYEKVSGHTVQRAGLVLTLVRGTMAMRRASRDLRLRYGGDVYKSEIKQTTGVAEAVESNLPLQMYSKTKRTLKTPLETIAREFLTRMQKLDSD